MFVAGQKLLHLQAVQCTLCHAAQLQQLSSTASGAALLVMRMAVFAEPGMFSEEGNLSQGGTPPVFQLPTVQASEFKHVSHLYLSLSEQEC